MPQPTSPPSASGPPAASSRRFRVLRRLGLALVLVVGTWVTLIAYPQPVFAYQAQQANIVLHARSPLPDEATPLLAEVADRVGWWTYRKLAAFQQEGYADHVAFNHAVDLAKGRRAVMADAFEMSPMRSGLYARYELLVAYLLQKRGWTPDGLLAKRLDQNTVEAELLARTDL